MWPEWSPWTWWAIALGLTPFLVLPTLYDHRKNLIAWLKRNKVISIVGVVALIAIVLVTIELFDTKVLQVPEKFSYSRFERPYLTLMGSEVRRNDQDEEEFTFFLQNNSDISAEEIIKQLIIIPNISNMAVTPIIEDGVTTSSMGPHGPRMRTWKGIQLNPGTNPAFIVFQIKYSGPLSNKLYSERFHHKFMGWPAEDESFERRLVLTSMDENDWIEEYMKKHEIPMF